MTASGGEQQVELVVRRVDGLLHGSAHDDAGHTREFTGLVGLVGALEALLADPATATTSEDT